MIAEACHLDSGKPSFDAWVSEVSAVQTRVKTYRKRLRGWLADEKVKSPPVAMPAKSRVIREPLGVVLIISPWNFPIELSIPPLAGAIAAGNCVLLKPSELAPNASALLARLLPMYVDADCVKVVEGGADVASALLKERFDHIFFTGSTRVGRVIMRAAAEHLTPVTLELGGKSPAIIDESAYLRVSARRLLWGKLLNAGQVCVAPDYALVCESVYDPFVVQLKATLLEFYGDDPQASPISDASSTQTTTGDCWRSFVAVATSSLAAPATRATSTLRRPRWRTCPTTRRGCGTRSSAPSCRSRR